MLGRILETIGLITFAAIWIVLGIMWYAGQTPIGLALYDIINWILTDGVTVLVWAVIGLVVFSLIGGIIYGFVDTSRMERDLRDHKDD